MSNRNDIDRVLDIPRVRTAAAMTAGSLRRTPMIESPALSDAIGGTVALKAENLQRTGSFKLRGALVKIASLPDAVTAVITGSAGNHAQSLAYAAGLTGLRCSVLMPETAALSKISAAKAAGAEVQLGGESVDECIKLAKQRAEEERWGFVHPFDDLDVISGQATLGLELIEDIPDLAHVVVPLGGGGLAGGVATVLKSALKAVRVTVVQAEECASSNDQRGPRATQPPRPTLADGIAIKRPGTLTGPLVRAFADEVVLASEDEIAQAMAFLLDREKLVVEGAGAVGVAAALAGKIQPAGGGTTVMLLSGGNVDTRVLGEICLWSDGQADRTVRLFTRIKDRPGSLAALLADIGRAGANIVGVEHLREGIPLQIDETGIEITLRTRGLEHIRGIRERLFDAGHAVEVNTGVRGTEPAVTTLKEDHT